jgi:hypothetical protein
MCGAVECAHRPMRAKPSLFAAAALLAVPVLLAGASRQDRQTSLLLNPDAPEFRVQAPERVTVRLDSSKGAIDIEVIRRWAPRSADRFVTLVRHGYYDGNSFFRVSAGPLGSVRCQRRLRDCQGVAHKNLSRRPVRRVECARDGGVRVRSAERTVADRCS